MKRLKYYSLLVYFLFLLPFITVLMVFSRTPKLSKPYRYIERLEAKMNNIATS